MEDCVRGFSARCGQVAQLGARMNGIHEVTGSIPVWSTNLDHLGLCRISADAHPRRVHDRQKAFLLAACVLSPVRRANERVSFLLKTIRAHEARGLRADR